MDAKSTKQSVNLSSSKQVKKIAGKQLFLLGVKDHDS